LTESPLDVESKTIFLAISTNGEGVFLIKPDSGETLSFNLESSLSSDFSAVLVTKAADFFQTCSFSELIPVPLSSCKRSDSHSPSLRSSSF